MNVHRVAITQHLFRHYRKGVLQKITAQEAPLPKYTVFYGSDCSGGALKTIEPKDFLGPDSKQRHQFRRLRDFMIGKHLLWQFGVIRLAWGREFDTCIFEGNMYFLSNWIGALLARLKGKRVLFWGHGFLRDEKRLKGWLRTQYYKLAHGQILYGAYARQLLIERGFSPDSLYVVCNSLDYDEQVRVRESIGERDRQNLRKELFSSPQNPILLWVGQLTAHKYLHMILDAAKLLMDRQCTVNILFIGDGPERESLLSRSEELGLHCKVRFYGACYDEERLGLLISSADLCVAPGEIGLTCMHSLVFGTPVVTHNSPEHQKPEWEAILPGEGGAFFKRGDTEDLARAIEEWLQCHKSRDEIRSRCSRMIDKYFNPVFQARVFNAAVENVPAGRLIPEELLERVWRRS